MKCPLHVLEVLLQLLRIQKHRLVHVEHLEVVNPTLVEQLRSAAGAEELAAIERSITLPAITLVYGCC